MKAAPGCQGWSQTRQSECDTRDKNSVGEIFHSQLLWKSPVLGKAAPDTESEIHPSHGEKTPLSRPQGAPVGLFLSEYDKASSHKNMQKKKKIKIISARAPPVRDSGAAATAVMSVGRTLPEEGVYSPRALWDQTPANSEPESAEEAS